MAAKENETICNKPRPCYKGEKKKTLKHQAWWDEVFWGQWYNLCVIGFLSSSTNVKTDTQVLSVLSDFGLMDVTFPSRNEHHTNVFIHDIHASLVTPLINYAPHLTV